MKLHDYQLQGAEFLALSPRALLADAPRVRKSAQALHAANLVDAKHVGIICPASVQAEWLKQVHLWRQRPWSWQIISYDRYVRAGFEKTADALVVDEAHLLKSRKAKRTAAVYGPRCDGRPIKAIPRVWLLTGTPTPNNSSELWTHLHATAPHLIGNMSYWQFVFRYCATMDNGFGTQIIGSRNTRELKERIRPWYLRRRREDVFAELPKWAFDTVHLTVDSIPQSLLDEFKDLEEQFELRGLDALRTAAPHHAKMRRALGALKVAPTLKWIENFLDTGEKLVVFAIHKEVIADLRRGLPGSVGITGETSLPDRNDAVKRFQEDPNCRVFVGNIGAAGVGLPLHAASTVLFVELDWTPGNNEQASKRIESMDKLGQHSVLAATVPGTIDDRVGQAVMQKIADLRSLWG